MPAARGHPGVIAFGVADYVAGLLGAFLVDPPRISGRAGREARFATWLPLGRLEERAWRVRIAAWQDQYREGIGAPGYGGSRGQRGWEATAFPGDVQPRVTVDCDAVIAGSGPAGTTAARC